MRAKLSSAERLQRDLAVRLLVRTPGVKIRHLAKALGVTVQRIYQVCPKKTPKPLLAPSMPGTRSVMEAPVIRWGDGGAMEVLDALPRVDNDGLRVSVLREPWPQPSALPRQDR